jgi:hypothetical protein
MNRIGPHDMLDPGTRVRCGVKIGHVVSAKVVNAIPRGTIVVHTIMFTDKFVRWPRRYIAKLEKPFKSEVNYSSIELFD